MFKETTSIDTGVTDTCTPRIRIENQLATFKENIGVTTQVVPLHFPVTVNGIFQFIKVPLIRGRQLNKHFICLYLICR